MGPMVLPLVSFMVLLPPLGHPPGGKIVFLVSRLFPLVAWLANRLAWLLGWLSLLWPRGFLTFLIFPRSKVALPPRGLVLRRFRVV